MYIYIYDTHITFSSRHTFPLSALPTPHYHCWPLSLLAFVCHNLNIMLATLSKPSVSQAAFIASLFIAALSCNVYNFGAFALASVNFY